MANPTVPSNSLPSTLAWASNVNSAVSASSSLTATVNVLPSTVSTTIPTVNAVPVVNSLPAMSGSMNVTSTPNMNLPMSTPAVNSLHTPQVSSVTPATPAVMATSTTNTTAIPTVVPSSLPLQGSPSRAALRTAPVAGAGADLTKVLDKQRLSELVKEVDPLEQLDDEVEEETYIPTPDISHLTTDDYDHVYEPAEDSFLLLDALQKEKKFITRHVKPAVCLEIGSGSGVISTFLAKLLGPNVAYFCTDINPKAAEITMRTGRQNNVNLNPVLTDLSLALQTRLLRQVDILVFNPPYVVTPSGEVGSSGIEASWAGGERGREVIDRFFPRVHTLLSEKGVFYLVIIKENNQNEIRNIMKGYGLKMSIVMARRSGPEFLSVLKFVNQKEVK